MVCYCKHALYPLHSFWGVQLNLGFTRWDTFFWSTTANIPMIMAHAHRGFSGCCWKMHISYTLLLPLWMFIPCCCCYCSFSLFAMEWRRNSFDSSQRARCFLYIKGCFNNNEAGVLRICNNHHHGHIHIIGKVAQCTSSCMYLWRFSWGHLLTQHAWSCIFARPCPSFKGNINKCQSLGNVW